MKRNLLIIIAFLVSISARAEEDEKATHIYTYNNIPASRELFASLGISYAFR